MKKLFFLILLLFGLFLLKPNNVNAEPKGPPYPDCGFSLIANGLPGKIIQQSGPTELYIDEIFNTKDVTVNFDLSKIPLENWNWFRQAGDRPAFFTRPLKIDYDQGGYFNCGEALPGPYTTKSIISDTRAFNVCGLDNTSNSHTIKLYYTNELNEDKILCQGSFGYIDKDFNANASIEIVSDNGLDDIDANWKVTIKNVSIPASWGIEDSRYIYVTFDGINLNAYDGGANLTKYLSDWGNNSFGFSSPRISLVKSYTGLYFTLKPLEAREHTVSLYVNGVIGYSPDKLIKSKSFKVLAKGQPTLTPTPRPTIPPQCIGKDAREARNNNPPDCSSTYIDCDWCKDVKAKPPQRPNIQIPNLKPLCDQLSGEFSGECWKCQKDGKIWSAIGCLPTDFTVLLKDYVFKIGVGAAGGMAFIYFLYGAFIILTSSGNAEKMEEAKQIITSALAGLILIIFSVFLLKVIGVDILKIPGFT